VAAGSSADHALRTPADRSAGVGTSAGRAAEQRRAADRRRAEIGVLVVMVFWAGNFIVVKGALEVLPPIGFSLLRFALASTILLALLRWREGTLRITPRELAPLALLGILGFGIYQILWTTALGRISAGDSAVLIASTPVLTALIAVAIGSDTLTRPKLVGAVVSFAGVVVVVGAGAGLDFAGEAVGYLLTLLAAVCWATYSAFGGPVLRGHSPLRATAWATVAGTAFLAIPGIVQLSAVEVSTIGVTSVLAVIYSGALSAGIANVVVLNGIGQLGPTRVTALQTLVPALAVVLAFIVLGEPIRIGQVVGGAIIVSGVALTRIGDSMAARRRRA
jgi:drug/metabolite transporter (DMT)-like permease